MFASGKTAAVASAANYIEDVFSTWLYTGNGSTQTITNGIDLAGKGGLVWTKARGTPNGTVRGHYLFDGSGSSYSALHSNTTGGRDVGYYINYNADGFSFPFGDASWNNSGDLFASWTFRKQAKFFDIVTYSGNGVAGREIPHNLGSTPGCVIIKCLNGETNWSTWHRGIATNQVLFLNTTDASYAEGDFYATAPTSTVFTVNSFGRVNGSGNTYVAYLFAHNAGGFGPSNTDNVISCGSYTGQGGTQFSVSLGYEPQWIMVKPSSQAGNWTIIDNMRGMVVNNNGSGMSMLRPNLSNAESAQINFIQPTSTGFTVGISGQSNSDFTTNGATYIYIAIRRGPMKVPTSGTSVFSPTGWTGSMATRTNTTGFVTDLNISRMRQNFSSAYNLGAYWETRLTGATQYLHSDATDAEAYQSDGLTSFASNTGVVFGADSTVQAWNYDNNYRNWSFKRAPGFFDEVCYTGTGSATTVTHNLGVTPELMIVKSRSGTGNWKVWNKSSLYTNLWLNSDAATQSDSVNSPTTTTFAVFNDSNTSGVTYVAHLFATCAGVSKVGSYTGNGSSQTINCGFVAGARFVMIKASSTTGNWVCADTNTINPGSDPALYMNNADLEVSGYDWIDITSTGFIVNETATIAANTNGVTYIFLAIA